jgi:heptosyltransferase-1
MGNVIHSLPAVAALRLALPQATFGWVIEERWVELLRCFAVGPGGDHPIRMPLVNRIHLVNTRKWRGAITSVATWREMAAAISGLRYGDYEAAVDFQGAARSALIGYWSGAPATYGFAQPRENVASMFYTRQVSTIRSHVVEQNLELASAVVGGALNNAEVDFSSEAAAETGMQQVLTEMGFGAYAIVNPGAGWGAKQWPAERYGEVAKKIAQQTGLKSLINVGPDESSLAGAVEQASCGSAKALACSVTELIAITRRARLFIGGDTGPMHLAAALRVPVIGIFGPTDPARNGPFGTRNIVLRSRASVTSLSHSRSQDRAMLEITPDDVVRAAIRLLEGARG